VAFAGFSDTAGNTNEKAIVELASLGLLKGYEDGTFKPAGNITRAEFAAVVVRALGYENSAKLLTGAPAFKDVAGTQWAWGYINVASAQGIIKGYPDGTFAPNANVTVAEAVTMLVRALGRDEQATGIWPTGHIMVASQLGMLPSSLPGVDVAAVRGIVAQLVANVLDKPFGYKDKDTGQWMAGTESFLTRNSASILKSRLVKDIDTADNTMTLAMVTGETQDPVEDLAVVCQFVGGSKLEDMKGQTVDVILNDDGDAIYIGTTSTGSVTGTCTAIDKVKKTITVGGKAYTVPDGAVAYYNGAQIVGDAILKITDLKDATVTLTLDKNGLVTFISATKLEFAGTVQSKTSAYSVGTNQLVILWSDGTKDTRNVDSEAVYVRNGATARWADVLVGDDVKYAVNDTDGFINYIDAYARKVSGTLQEAVTTNNHITFKVNDVVYAVIVDDDGIDAYADATKDTTTGNTRATPSAAIVLTLNRDGKVTKIELQSETAATAVMTLQSKTKTYDSDGKLVRKLTLSDGSVIKITQVGYTVTRNGLTKADYGIYLTGDAADPFEFLKSGDSILLGIPESDGTFKIVKAFGTVSGYPYRPTGWLADEFYICESSGAPNTTDPYHLLARIKVGANELARTNPDSPSSVFVNGVQQVVTPILGSDNPYPGNSSRYQMKISSWVLSKNRQYANFIYKKYDSIDAKLTSVIVKSILSDGTKTIYLMHKSTLSTVVYERDRYLEIGDDAIVQRSDAAFDKTKIAVGDKLSLASVTNRAGGSASRGLTKEDPWVAAFVYDSADTSAPSFWDNEDSDATAVNGPYAKPTVAKTVFFNATEDSLLRYKVYSASGTLLFTSDWIEVPGSTAADYSVSCAGDTITFPSGDSKCTMVLTFKDYTGNTSAPVSVLVKIN